MNTFFLGSDVAKARLDCALLRKLVQVAFSILKPGKPCNPFGSNSPPLGA